MSQEAFKAALDTFESADQEFRAASATMTNALVDLNAAVEQRFAALADLAVHMPNGVEMEHPGRPGVTIKRDRTNIVLCGVSVPNLSGEAS